MKLDNGCLPTPLTAGPIAIWLTYVLCLAPDVLDWKSRIGNFYLEQLCNWRKGAFSRDTPIMSGSGLWRSRAHALQRPARVLGNKRILVADQVFQHRQKALVTSVAHCDRNVAAKPVESATFQRRAAKHFSKIFGGELGQPLEIGIDRFTTRLEFL